MGEKLDLASEVEFPAQSGGQLALSPPHSGATTPSPFMQFAASLAAYQGKTAASSVIATAVTVFPL